ncbi:hypothetical protein [Chondrinema litorale]|uniref:hypothetical protein n=1 Tax=Chondrinema litorale TaxID=2994555 RepID=UPI002543DAC9|nr:hypothetical protein [Chondrinema litorale]UZR96476.1 hypothetical protein OQ292_22730 [Chondrinema litorale]
MIIKQKFKTALALGFVFFLILATNMVDNNHFKIVKESLATVYADRIVVKDYLYKIARQIQLKKTTLFQEDLAKIKRINQVTNDSIQTLINKYTVTKLTDDEAEIFNTLQHHLIELRVLEKSLNEQSELSKDSTLFENINLQYSIIMFDLDALSEIQVKESERQIVYSTRAIKNSNTISRIEIIVLIVIGVMIQLVIFYKPR